MAQHMDFEEAVVLLLKGKATHLRFKNQNSLFSRF
jgi:hypothetical protein